MNCNECRHDSRARVALLFAATMCLLQACTKAGTTPRMTSSAGDATEPGTHDRSMEFDGRTRTYRIHIPPAYAKRDDRKSVPLVLAFHGRFGSGKSQEKLSGMDEVADREGFIVVYPDGIQRSWNAGTGAGPAERDHVDDVGFVSALIDALSHEYDVDRGRVYATGMSNGAIFTHRLGCELAGKIAAIAPVAGTIAPKVAAHCRPERPVAVIEIHGTADPWLSWDGKIKDSNGRAESVLATIKHWVEIDGCKSKPEVTDLSGGVIRETYAPCNDGAEVVLYKIEGGGHTWPDGYQYLPAFMIGKTNRSINASRVIWDFFAAHPGK